MPITPPDLDDLRFSTVRDLLLRQIPVVAPEWTNHNESDPGIAMIHLFAYLAEQVGFRLNRVPDKNYVEFLRLLGVKLRPAEAARTMVQLLLTKPEVAEAFLLPATAAMKAKGSGSGAPPVFETVADLDAVPAQLAALCTTASDDLRQIRLAGDTDNDATAADFLRSRFALVWDGKSPKLKDMPLQPVPVFTGGAASGQQHLWIGLAFNPALTAGFLGQRVTLTVQLDDDDQPDPNAAVSCAGGAVVADVADVPAADPDQEPSPVSYAFYRPPQVLLSETSGTWRTLTPLSDSTDRWSRSGRIRFDVPSVLGPIPNSEWSQVLTPAPMTLSSICEAAKSAPASPPAKPIPHPMVGAIKNPVEVPPSAGDVPVSGWLRVSFDGRPPSFFLRAVSFNVVEAIQAQTIRGEVLGRGNAKPGQMFQLAHGNVLAGTLQLAVGDPIDGELHEWREVESFDAEGPDSRVFVLDNEPGQVVFGDGVRGRPPPDTQSVVALQYQYGGGKAGEVGVAQITRLDSPPSQVQDAVNIVAALGGKDAETLDEAKARAPKELKVLGRAVTAEDFELITRQTPGLRVARAQVVPLRGPLPLPAGLDLETPRPGALSVVVVPDTPGLFPTPTETMLRKVCAWLDRHRLVTTEVFVVPPMYVRLYDVRVTVKPGRGQSSVLLREAIAAHLESRLHVLTGPGGGFPFGGSLHHADLVAEIFRVDGVETVISVEAWADGSKPAVDGEKPVFTWREERRTPVRLTGCVEDAEVDVTVIELGADENLFVDASNLLVSIET